MPKVTKENVAEPDSLSTAVATGLSEIQVETSLSV